MMDVLSCLYVCLSGLQLLGMIEKKSGKCEES